ncbi:parallel beta-helix domain-containing protein [Roseobacteraceae bacterium NS-SX3]
MTRTFTSMAAFSAAFLTTAAAAAELRVASGASIQAVVDQAASGDTVLVEPGTYHQSVYVDKPGITLRGLRDGDSWATLDGKMLLNDGIIAAGHSSVIDGFYIKGYKGNGIMTQGANNFEIINNHVEGAFYGIFPQFGTNGLVEGNTVSGAEDAGIYVGMSDNVDVTGNTAYGNVMGLEFENTRNGLMAGNHIYGNATGIALTLIPGLPVKDAYGLVIRDNVIEDNNIENFAPASSIAASVPSGVGIAIVGPDQVTIENNEIRNHGTLGVLISDLTAFGLATDPKNDPYADEIRIMKNSWSGNGEAMSGALGSMIGAAGASGIEVMSIGKGRGSCLLAHAGADALGTSRWDDCDPSMSKAGYSTAQINGGAEEPVYTAEQKGRLTYLAVCTGCHAYDSVLHGPSMQSIQAIYKENPEGLASYARAPVVKREGFPEMPPQAYLGEDNLAAIAAYILDDLGKE